MGIENILFVVMLLAAGGLFAMQVRAIRANIALGLALNRSDNKSERWKTMARVALGQGKMGKRPIAALLHLIVYLGFVIINIEVLEIVIDGITGEHRVFAGIGALYNGLIASFEVLAMLVLLACLVFLIRRNVLKVPRFHFREMTKWPKNDANIILIVEVLLMSAFLIMNAADQILQSRGEQHYVIAGAFPISKMLAPAFEGMSSSNLVMIERGLWWFHIAGILAFLNYLPMSKHLHIIMAFPNTWYSSLKPKGQFTNMESVTAEVKLMFDPSADPYAAPQVAAEGDAPKRFGAKDVTDLTWKNLMDAYTCTECGRCSSACPANQTGKLLSPRKIMMDTRDRMEEIGKNRAQKGKDYQDEKTLLGDYITEEELWACTSCNACVEECPVNIDPLNIIMEMRRYLVMEESKAPQELAMMFTNVENNGAPWQFAASDRLKWTEEL